LGSDTAGAARAAALVWGIGEEGMMIFEHLQLSPS
jgi:hypothetical protein